jgi:hypothetical protein
MGHHRWIDPWAVVGNDFQALAFLAVFAKSVAACSGATLIGWDVATRRAGIVIVVDTFSSGFLVFVDGVKRWNFCHRGTSPYGAHDRRSMRPDAIHCYLN